MLCHLCTCTGTCTCTGGCTCAGCRTCADTVVCAFACNYTNVFTCDFACTCVCTIGWLGDDVNVIRVGIASAGVGQLAERW